MEQLKTLKSLSKNGASSDYSGDWSIDYDDLQDAAREWIKSLEQKCLDAEHDPNELIYCGCQDETINWIKHFFNIED